MNKKREIERSVARKKRLLSQATNSQNSVSTRPTPARSRPDLSALFHAVLRRAISGQQRLKRLHFYLSEFFGKCQKTVQNKTKKKQKRTEQTNKCSSRLCLLCFCTLTSDSVCVSIQTHVLYASICRCACVCWQHVT